MGNLTRLSDSTQTIANLVADVRRKVVDSDGEDVGEVDDLLYR